MSKARSNSAYASLEPARPARQGRLRRWWLQWRGRKVQPEADGPDPEGDPPPAPPGLDESAFATTAEQPLRDETTWTLRRIQNLDSPDFERLVELVCANSSYRRQTQARDAQRSDAVDLLTEAPEGTKPSQKYVWGLWHQDRLVACVEVIRGWPMVHYVYIGFLLVDERQRRKGYANVVLRLLAQRTRQWAGIRRWRLAVVESQADALKFWRQAGFMPTGQKVSAPQYRVPLVVMEKRVTR